MEACANNNRYIQGHGILIGMIGMSFVLSLIMTIYLRIENQRRDKWARDNRMFPDEYTEEQTRQESEKGDYATFYRYTT